MFRPAFTKKIATCALLGAAAIALSPSAARAHEEPEAVNSGNVSFAGGIDWTSAYFFRGILQEDQGVIAQPWAEATFALYEGDGFIKDAGLTIGAWASLHDEDTGASLSSNVDAWYEFDFYTGVAFTLPSNWSTGVTYTAYTSPNDAFDTIHEIALGVGYDDSEAWGDVIKLNGFTGFQPSATLAFELDNQADGGLDEGTYLELAIAPGFTLVDSESMPVAISFPVTLGLSVDDYYEDGTGDDDTFGYLRAGVSLSTPLSFIPSGFGGWELGLGVDALLLGDHMETLNNNDDFEIIGTLSLSMSY